MEDGEDFGSDESESVCNYFKRSRNKQNATCNKCQQIIKTTGGTTSGLHKHLRTIHQTKVKKSPPHTQSASEMTTDNAKITSFFKTTKDESLGALLSRMTAKDGLPFSIFCTSEDLRKLIKDKGFEDLPKYSNAIKSKVMKYAKKIRDQHKMEIVQLLENRKVFSVTFDEWTSNRNRRYLNINLHCSGKLWNLGLAALKGSITSEKLLDAVERKISSTVGLKLQNNIFCHTTDGAAVMTKFAKLSPTLHQLCFVHGIHLAVLDVLYPKKQAILADAAKKDIEQNNFDEESESETENADTEDGSNTDDDSDEQEDGFAVSIERNKTEITNASMLPTITKVRQIVRMFRKSPTKNDELQKHVKADKGAPYALILDTKTRWNSLLFMLKRFEFLKDSIRKALIDVKCSTTIEESEFTAIADIVQGLEPLEAIVRALCRRDANLLTADASMSFAISKLQGQTNEFSTKLLQSFKRRIKERRTYLSTLLQFLHNGTFDLPGYDEDVFESATDIKHAAGVIKSIIQRLDLQERSTETSSTTEEDDSNIQTNKSSDNVEPQPKKAKIKIIDLEVELNQAIKGALISSHVQKSHNPSKNLLATIKREITLFQDGGPKGHNLQFVYDCLLSVCPTSVDSERAFSSAGYLCSKIRSSLADETLDELSFLRAHFQRTT